jgi:hypothetical protein
MSDNSLYYFLWHVAMPRASIQPGSMGVMCDCLGLYPLRLFIYREQCTFPISWQKWTILGHKHFTHHAMVSVPGITWPSGIYQTCSGQRGGPTTFHIPVQQMAYAGTMYGICWRNVWHMTAIESTFDLKISIRCCWPSLEIGWVLFRFGHPSLFGYNW